MDSYVLLNCFSRVGLFVTLGMVGPRLLCPWNFLDKKTGVGCHSLFQGILLTQGSNPGLLHCRQTLYCLSHQGSSDCGGNHISNIIPMEDNKAMVFPVVMYGYESWTVKKAEHRRIDAFELWCWRRLLRVPWTARRSNQSVLKEINPEYSLEGLMLKLKLQYFGYLMRRTDSLEKILMLGKTEGRRIRGQQEER